MSKIVYSQKRATRLEALRHLVTAILFPIAMWFMIEVVGKGVASSQQKFYVLAGSFAVTFFIVVVFVVPNFQKNSLFEFAVTQKEVRCESPEVGRYSVNIAEILEIEQIKDPRSAYFEEWIHTKGGEQFRIPPANYGMDQHKAIKAILALNPEIRRVVKCEY